MCSFWALYVASVDAVLEFRLFVASFAANTCPESDGLLLYLWQGKTNNAGSQRSK